MTEGGGIILESLPVFMHIQVAEPQQVPVDHETSILQEMCSVLQEVDKEVSSLPKAAKTYEPVGRM